MNGIGQDITSDRSIGIQWVGVLITLFAAVLMKLFILPIIKNQLVPNLLANVPASETAAYNGLQNVYTFMTYIPYILVFISFIYAFVIIFWKEQTDMYMG